MSDQNPNQPDQSPFQPPEGVDVPDIAEIERLRGELWGELDAKNYTPEQIKREQDKKYPLPKIAEQIEQEEADAIARNLGATALEKPKRRTYKRRGRDPKGGGPPPHISAEIRGEPKD